MKPNISAIGFAILAIFLFSSCGADNTARQNSVVPSAQVTATTSVENGRLTFSVRVPEGHHAYLDSGDEGNLVPVTFFWEPLIEKGTIDKAPKQISTPEGIRDEDFQANVLRGTGSYEFQLAQANIERLRGLSLKVRTQVCDETRGICYRPRTDDVMIQ